jgi:hypothetical protein
MIRDVTGATATDDTSITITTSGSHQFGGNRPVTFADMPGGWSALNGNTYTTTAASGSTFSVAVDGSGFGTYTSGGTVVGRGTVVSPWGTSQAWYDSGNLWTTSDQSAYLQAQYPEPPRVILLANNETDRLSYTFAFFETRYRALFADYAARTEAQIMSDTHDRMIAQWNELFDGMDAGLSADWLSARINVGYNAFPTQKFRTVYGWFNYQTQGTVATFNKLSWQWFSWGGGSPEVYDNQWQVGTSENYPANYKAPFLTWSPQHEAMSMVFQRDIAEGVNPDYWFEISIWDGDMWEGANSYPDFFGGNGNYDHPKAVKYRALGIDLTPDYYKGWTQYCMWITRPRCVREFRYFRVGVDDTSTPNYWDYWQAVLDQVSHVHQHPTLRRFWRDGAMVESTTITSVYPSGVNNTHPFDHRDYTADGSLAGGTWNGYPKNYRLATNLDPDTSGLWGTFDSWDAAKNVEWPVYTLAYRIGTTPNREFLIYAHSTGISGTTLEDVVVTIPDYDDVTLPEVPVEGAFYYIKEAA